MLNAGAWGLIILVILLVVALIWGYPWWTIFWVWVIILIVAWLYSSGVHKGMQLQ